MCNLYSVTTNREAMRRDAFTHGLWQFRVGTGNFAWAGIDMALWDVCGRACEQPLWRLLGGLQQKEATYFFYLARGTRESLVAQVTEGLADQPEVLLADLIGRPGANPGCKSRGADEVGEQDGDCLDVGYWGTPTSLVARQRRNS